MSNEVSKFQDEIRKSKSKVILLLFRQQDLKQDSDEWINIQKLVGMEHLEQRRNMLRIAIADSIYRSTNYQTKRDALSIIHKDWAELDWYVVSEKDMQDRLTKQLNDIK